MEDADPPLDAVTALLNAATALMNAGDRENAGQALDAGSRWMRRCRPESLDPEQAARRQQELDRGRKLRADLARTTPDELPEEHPEDEPESWEPVSGNASWLLRRENGKYTVLHQDARDGMWTVGTGPSQEKDRASPTCWQPEKYGSPEQALNAIGPETSGKQPPAGAGTATGRPPGGAAN